jgi:hypothetical protein
MFAPGEAAGQLNSKKNSARMEVVQPKEGEDQEAVICQPSNPRLAHRRATTNLVSPQTLQPSSSAVPNRLIQNDDLIADRDKLIKYLKIYTKKRLEVPETTLDYYKFVKLIGKGAFGKVTLGIHKLTGK